MEDNEQQTPAEALLPEDQIAKIEKDSSFIANAIPATRTFKDDRDNSINPSYTNFKIPYHILCRDRYVRSRELYERQFQHEIAEILTQHGTAYEVARFQRHMAISTLWPPLHNRSEIKAVRAFFRLSRKQKKRLQYIMSTNII